MVTLSPPPHNGLTSLIIVSIASRATAMIKLARMIDANLIAISHALRRAQFARAHHGYCYTPCARAKICASPLACDSVVFVENCLMSVWYPLDTLTVRLG